MADITIPLFSTPEGFKRRSRRKLKSRLSVVYSIPRDRGVLIDPLVIEFTVPAFTVRREGGWIAGGKKVRALSAFKKVRPRA